MNVEGPFLFAKAVLPQMKQQGSGSIITISSERATSTDGSGAAYASSKAAVDRFMVKLAADVKEHGVAVNSLYPGWTAVEVSRPDPRRPTPYETNVIPACVLLATQTGDGITGQILDQADFGVRWP